MAILRRTIYLDESKDYKKFADWAMVTTSLGRMAEPFQYPGAKHANGVSVADFDWNDEMNMINLIKPFAEDILPSFLSGGVRDGEGPTIGGNLTQLA